MKVIRKNQKLIAIIFTAALMLIAIASAGCVNFGNAAGNQPVLENTSDTQLTDEKLIDTKLTADEQLTGGKLTSEEKLTDKELTAAASKLNPAYPNALARGTYYYYTDDTRDNDIKVTVVKDTGKKVTSLEYLDPALDDDVKLTPNPGNIYYCVAVSYTHSGLRSLDQEVQTVTTPATALHRLYDADGTMYRPMQLNVIYIYHLFGNYYQPTVLERMNNKEDKKSFKGWLIYEVPEDFSAEGAYLTINLGKWGTPAWKLWG